MARISGIYKIENVVNGKRYIGSSVDIEKRRNTHFSRLNRNVHSNDHLQGAWIKYGKESFSFDILEEVEDKKILLDVEQWYLDNVVEWGFDYNMSTSASAPMLGRNHTEEARKKISKESSKRSHTEEAKKKISEANIGRVGVKYWLGKRRSEKTKEKISKSLSGENHPMYGKKITNKKHLERLCRAHQGEKSPNAKLTEETVLMIREIYSKKLATQKELAKMFGVSQQNIQLIVTGKRWKHI